MKELKLNKLLKLEKKELKKIKGRDKVPCECVCDGFGVQLDTLSSAKITMLY